MRAIWRANSTPSISSIWRSQNTSSRAQMLVSSGGLRVLRAFMARDIGDLKLLQLARQQFEHEGNVND